eukprot:6053679-Alexandrium_andersonii.AAC.1
MIPPAGPEPPWAGGFPPPCHRCSLRLRSTNRHPASLALLLLAALAACSNSSSRPCPTASRECRKPRECRGLSNCR